MSNKYAIDLHNLITPEQATRIIETNIKTIMANSEMCREISPIMLRGGPGVGKSTIIKDIADRLGIGFIDIRLSQMEPVDLRGLPVPNKDTNTVEWFVSADLPNEKRDGKYGILLFDELTSADRSLQVASYELILDRRLGQLYKIPDGWYIVACGNRVEDRAVATMMSSALANRLMHFDMEPNAEDWGNWGISHEIHPTVTGFIKFRPDCLFDMEGQNLEHGWPSPRSWARVSTMINLYGNDEETLRPIVYGLIGNKVGIEFMQFYKINKNFSNVLEMMVNPNCPIEIPTKADEIAAMCAAMQYLVWKGKNEEDQARRIDGFMRICIKFDPDFASMTMMGAMQGNKNISKEQACKLLYNHPLFQSWCEKHNKKLKTKFVI